MDCKTPLELSTDDEPSKSSVCEKCYQIYKLAALDIEKCRWNKFIPEWTVQHPYKFETAMNRLNVDFATITMFFLLSTDLS